MTLVYAYLVLALAVCAWVVAEIRDYRRFTRYVRVCREKAEASKANVIVMRDFVSVEQRRKAFAEQGYLADEIQVEKLS